MIIPYEDKYEGVWDTFVLKESIMGIFYKQEIFIIIMQKINLKLLVMLFWD